MRTLLGAVEDLSILNVFGMTWMRVEFLNWETLHYRKTSKLWVNYIVRLEQRVGYLTSFQLSKTEYCPVFQMKWCPCSRLRIVSFLGPDTSASSLWRLWPLKIFLYSWQRNYLFNRLGLKIPVASFSSQMASKVGTHPFSLSKSKLVFVSSSQTSRPAASWNHLEPLHLPLWAN